MNDDLSDVIWRVRQMEFDWLFAMVLWLLMWSSLSYPHVYLFSLVPPFSTYPILAVTVRIHGWCTTAA